MGLLLEARAEVVPEQGSAFLVADQQLLVQAVSSAAEDLLGVREEDAVNRPLTELLVPADAEAGEAGVGALVARAAADADAPTRAFVRPANMFGVRIRARIASCGPPRAALIVLDSGPGPRLRAL
jgi:PAS domain-containing protein